MDIEKDIEPAKADARHENVDELKDGVDENKNLGTLERKLKSRHIQFMALSGAIGKKIEGRKSSRCLRHALTLCPSKSRYRSVCWLRSGPLACWSAFCLLGKEFKALSLSTVPDIR